MSDIVLITEEQKKEISEKFNHDLQQDIIACVYSVDGMIGMTGSKLAIMAAISTLIYSAIDNKIFKDIDDACAKIKEFIEVTKD